MYFAWTALHLLKYARKLNAGGGIFSSRIKRTKSHSLTHSLFTQTHYLNSHVVCFHPFRFRTLHSVFHLTSTLTLTPSLSLPFCIHLHPSRSQQIKVISRPVRFLKTPFATSISTVLTLAFSQSSHSNVLRRVGGGGGYDRVKS